MWPFSAICENHTRLSWHTVVITGANSGIGRETARELYWRGAKVILACRDIAKGEDTVNYIRNNEPERLDLDQYKGGVGAVVAVKLDLSNLESVRECAKTLNYTEANIHILINNAGVFCPQMKSDDGLDLQFQVNYLSHFLLTLLLLPKMKESMPNGRIINVSSIGHRLGQIYFEDLNLETSYTPIKAYAQSKLASILFAKELARKLEEVGITRITTYSLHPGLILTDMDRYIDTIYYRGTRTLLRMVGKYFMKTPELGAQTTIHCATDEYIADESGLYYKECSVVEPSSSAKNKGDAQKLWKESLKLVGLPPIENLGELLEYITDKILSFE